MSTPVSTEAGRGPAPLGTRARPGTGHLPPLPARHGSLGRGRRETPFAWLPWVLLSALILTVALLLAIGAAVGDDAPPSNGTGARAASTSPAPALPTVWS